MPSTPPRADARLAFAERPGLATFLRHQAATLVATGCDLTVYAALAIGAGVAAPLAALLGSALGGVVHFTLARAQVFRDARPASLGPQAARYAVASATSAMGNAGGVALLVGLLGPMPARLLTSVFVAMGVSWPLHRLWVFPRAGRAVDGEGEGEAAHLAPAAERV